MRRMGDWFENPYEEKEMTSRERRKLSTRRTAYKCNDCGNRQEHFKFQFFKAAPPRCTGCGGALTRVKPPKRAKRQVEIKTELTAKQRATYNANVAQSIANGRKT